jgi:adenylate cyclase
VVRQTAFAIGAANVIGGVLVAVFLVWVVPVPGPRAQGREVNLILAVVYLLAASVVGQLLGRRTGAPVLSWLREGRRPDARERDVTLRQALLQARNVAALWGVAAVLFAGVNAFYSGALALEVGVTVAMGGIVTAALCYLLAERIGRPVMALALADHPPRRPVIPGVATRMVLAWSSGTAVAVLGAALVAAEFLAAGTTSPRRMAVTVLFLCAAALLVGLATAVFAARSLADPLESIRLALAEVEAGSTDVEVPVYDGNEVGLLQAGFNSMVAGLRERERIRDLFGRHVGEDVARQALARGISLGGETREAAVLFVDLVGSTTLAATDDPTVVVATLNRFFAIVTEVVARHGGWVNKFEGDAALCVFGALAEPPDPAAALAAGRELSARLQQELPTLAAGIGLSAGQVVAGNIGGADRYEYTVIGDPVNEAARLADLAKPGPQRVLAAEAIVTRARTSEASQWRLGEAVTLRGRPTPTRIAAPVSQLRAPRAGSGRFCGG